MKRYQAQGNAEEYGDWIVALIDLPSTDVNGCRSALLTLLDATQDMSAFTAGIDGQSLRHFTLCFTSNNGASELMHERDFWKSAATFAELHSLIRQYVKQVNVPSEYPTWQDEFHPRGAYAIAELSLKSAQDCSLLGDLLFQWDMGYETFQHALINQLFIEHGINDATLDLLACRILASGQSTSQQLGELLYGLKLRNTLSLSNFASHCMRRAALSNAPDIGLQDFAEIWSAGDEREYQAVWRAFRDAGIGMEIEAGEFMEGVRYECEQIDDLRSTEDWNADFYDASVDKFTLETLLKLD